jgi:hypothetical protein
MTLPKKGLRSIVVDKVKYAWKITGRDENIGLSKIPRGHQDRIISAAFDYHSKVYHEQIFLDGTKTQAARQQIIITNYIVRQVILYAFKTGWNPKGDVRIFIWVESTIK